MISCKIWVAVKLASFNKVKPFNFTFWKLLEHSSVILIRVCALSSCRNLQLFVYNRTTTTADNDSNSSSVQKSSNFCPTITIEAVAKTNNFQMIGFFSSLCWPKYTNNMSAKIALLLSFKTELLLLLEPWKLDEFKHSIF